MNLTLEQLRQEVQNLYANTGFSYVTTTLQVSNARQLEAFKKLFPTLGTENKSRQRYLDPIQKAKVDNLVRSITEENERIAAKKALGALKHAKKFR